MISMKLTLFAVVMLSLPLTHVEHAIVRKNSRLQNISVDTLQKYIIALTKEVEKVIANALPEKGVIIFDGWSKKFHYVAWIARFPNKKNPEIVEDILLGFAPLLDEKSQGNCFA